MSETAIKCTVCDGISYLWVKLQELELRKCKTCSHCFTDQTTIQPETYSADYYLKTHRQWFENPNYGLFSTIHQDLLKRNATCVLDAGCGNGDFLKYLAANNNSFSLYGIDLAPIDEITKKSHNITFLQGDFLTHTFSTKFDAIISLAVIEHLEDVRAFQKRIHTLLRDDGIAYIMTINRDGFLYSLANIMRKIGFSFIFKRLYDPHHLNHFNKNSLESLLTQDNNFTVLKVINHNVPLKAIDVPMHKGIISTVMRVGVKAIFIVGKIFRKTYLQTVIVKKQKMGVENPQYALVNIFIP